MKNVAIAMKEIRDAMPRILRAPNNSKRYNAWHRTEKNRNGTLYKQEYTHGSQ